MEYGIRVFLKNGKYDDFDPMESGDVTYTEDKVLIQDGRWEFPISEVDYISQYDLSRCEDDVWWIRGFDDEGDVREKNDYVKGSPK